MSGQQIGTVVGTVVGAYFGYPQLGAAIGGLIGGAVDPEKFYGPRIGDGPQQSSNEGVPIPWILGTAAVQGNLVQKSARREVKKKERQGKGGPVKITYEAHQDFAIMICESSETRGSSMVGVAMVKENGKIVYDKRPGANFDAESAKWAKGVTFYDGNESQMPDPTLEAITGVGNTPAYRGVFLAVFKDFNLTSFGDSIPTFEWVMVSEGEEVTTVTETIALPTYAQFSNADYPLASAEAYYTFHGYRKTFSGINHDYVGDSIASVIAHFNAFGYDGTPSNLGEYIGYSAATTENAVVDFSFNRYVEQPDITDNQKVVLIYSEAQPADYVYTESTACSMPYSPPGFPAWHATPIGRLIRITRGGVSYPGYEGVNNCTSFPPDPITSSYPTVIGVPPLYIVVTRRTAPPSVPPIGDPCVLGVPVQMPDAPGFQVDCEGNVNPAKSYILVTGNFLLLQEEIIGTHPDGRLYFQQYALGPILEGTDPLNTQAFWEAAYADAVAGGDMPAGLVYPGDYPEDIMTAYRATESTTIITNAAISVASSIERICKRGGLIDSQVDTSEVDQTLLGYPISSQYDASECVRPLLMAYSLYGSEYDAQIHFRKHGADVDVVISADDLIEATDASDESTRDQAKEYPRKLSLSYIDIDQNFAVRPQTRQSITPDVRSIGEQSLEVAVVMVADEAAQLVDIIWKRSRARVQGRRKFAVPFGTSIDCYLAMVPGEPIAFDSKRYMLDQMTMEDGQLNLELLYDRQSAYTSDVTAIPALPPTPPVSSLNGPTLVAVMNLPVLRDQDDKLGVYVAVAGVLSSWRGAQLQLSRDDGARWTVINEEMTIESVMGYLTAPLALAPWTATDVTNELLVNVHGGELDSITETQLLNEANPAAILYADRSAEIIQFQTAVQDAPRDYTLSILPRGRLNTVPGSHNTGDQFVQLDNVYFIELTVADIGRDLLFRAVSFGSSADANPSYALTYTDPISQTEWMPEYLVGVRGGNDLSVSVTPRHRLGTDATPVASANFTGFRWTFTVGADSLTVDTINPSYDLTEAQQITAFGSAQPSIVVSVSQLNRITGPGPALEETL